MSEGSCEVENVVRYLKDPDWLLWTLGSFKLGFLGYMNTSFKTKIASVNGTKLKIWQQIQDSHTIKEQ